MKRLFITFLAAALFIAASSSRSFCQTENIFNTKYTTIHYNYPGDLSDFLWRLGGTRIDFMRDRELAKSRIDRVVERVEAILDMHPKDLRIDIYLKRGKLEFNERAYYENKTGSVYVSVDNVTDGVFSHEITHAIVNKSFINAASSKIQEIISNYVDRYLWSDY